MAELTYREAVALALAQEMERDPDVVLIGEDIGAGGVVKTTKGLFERFGPGTGARHPDLRAGHRRRGHGRRDGGPAAGRRDHVLGLLRHLLGRRRQRDHQGPVHDGRAGAPPARHPVRERGRHLGSQHSQAVENWAMCVPGLKIVAPSTPADMAGLLAAAVRDDDPVLVFEHKALFGGRGPVEDGEQFVPLGAAAVRRRGDDVTLVGLGATVPLCLEAAATLADDGITAQVIDLRCLVPLDARAVLDSVARTGRIVLAEENPGQLGWAAAVAAIVAEEAFGDLRAPVLRVSGGNVPLPVARELELETFASAGRVVAAARRAAGHAGRVTAPG